MGKNVIIACDFNSKEKLVSFLDKMEGADPNFYCKVGMELFDTGAMDEFQAVKIIKERGHNVFLDLKLHDIPNTVASTVAKLTEAGADMINIHTLGGKKMMEAAVKARNEVCDAKNIERPIILGVTVLTSMGKTDLEEVGINDTPLDEVVRLAKLAQEAGLDGVVCSPREIMAVKSACGDDFITVTPGIRFSDSKKDDQTRIATPACANIMGSDYIVVGRPITAAEDQVAAYNRCKKDFTEEVTDQAEIENAAEYIKNLKEEVNASSIVAQKLLDASAVKINTEDPFLLKSGIGAPIYMNNRDLYKCPQEQRVIMDYLAELIRTHYPEVEEIFGTPMSAISFGALVAERLGLPFGFVRKEKKDHGLNTSIEGIVKPGMKVVQIEDLISTGESSLEFIEPLKEKGLDVLGIAAIVDNDFIPSVKLMENGIPYYAITTASKIAEYASASGIISPEDLEKVKQYADDPSNESWMSEVAKEKIEQKRLQRSMPSQAQLVVDPKKEK